MWPSSQKKEAEPVKITAAMIPEWSGGKKEERKSEDCDTVFIDRPPPDQQTLDRLDKLEKSFHSILGHLATLAVDQQKILVNQRDMAERIRVLDEDIGQASDAMGSFAMDVGQLRKEIGKVGVETGKLTGRVEQLHGDVREINSVVVGISERKRNRWLRSGQPFRFQPDHPSGIKPVAGSLMLN